MPKYEIISMGLSLKVHSEDTVYLIVCGCNTGSDGLGQFSVAPRYISRYVWVEMDVVKRLPMGVNYFCFLKQVYVQPDTGRSPTC